MRKGLKDIGIEIINVNQFFSEVDSDSSGEISLTECFGGMCKLRERLKQQEASIWLLRGTMQDLVQDMDAGSRGTGGTHHRGGAISAVDDEEHMEERVIPRAAFMEKCLSPEVKQSFKMHGIFTDPAHLWDEAVNEAHSR